MKPRPQPAPLSTLWCAVLLTFAGITSTVLPATATELEPELLTQMEATLEAAEEAIARLRDEAAKEGRTPQFAAQEASGTPAFVGGRILNVHGEALSGVQVKVATTDVSTTTESEGWFYIDLGQLNDLPWEVPLEISQEGYRAQKATVDPGGYVFLFMVEEGQVSGDTTLTFDEPLYDRILRQLRALQ